MPWAFLSSHTSVQGSIYMSNNSRPQTECRSKGAAPAPQHTPERLGEQVRSLLAQLSSQKTRKSLTAASDKLFNDSSASSVSVFNANTAKIDRHEGRPPRSRGQEA